MESPTPPDGPEPERRPDDVATRPEEALNGVKPLASSSELASPELAAPELASAAAPTGAPESGSGGEPPEYVGPYQFPDIKRRRIPGAMYLGTGLVMVVAYFATRSGDPINVSKGFGLGGAVLIAVGGYHIVAGWPLAINQTEALGAASRQIGFPVGHASAQLGWRGFLSRPTWRILLYSAENPPAKRGLILIDAVDASVVGSLVHDNPEDWSEYDA